MLLRTLLWEIITMCEEIEKDECVDEAELRALLTLAFVLIVAHPLNADKPNSVEIDYPTESGSVMFNLGYKDKSKNKSVDCGEFCDYFRNVFENE